MKAVLDQLGSYNPPPIPSLPAAMARQLPSPTTAAMEVLSKQGKPTFGPIGDIRHIVIPGPNGNRLLARVYRPQGASGTLPVTVYFQGGGWVIANLDTYDPSCRGLANASGSMIVSVAYRKAPEAKFPAAHEDAYAATQWVMRNAASFGGDSRRVAIAGESAGGNLATSVCLMARQRGGRMPRAQLLVYPITQYGDFNTPSYRDSAAAKPLDRPTMQWFFRQYLRTPADGRTPWVSPLRANLRGLPPAKVILAEIDPLRSEGQQYATRLNQAGVRTSSTLYRGVAHEFFGMAALVDEARRAQQEAGEFLRNNLQ